MIDQDLDQDPRYLADMDSLLDRIVKRTRSAHLHLDKKTPWLAMLAAHLRALDTTPEPEPEPAPAPAPALVVEPELVIHPNARRYKPVEEGPVVDLDRVAQLRSEGKTWREIRGHMGIGIHRMMADVRMWRPDILGPISRPKPEPEPEPEPKRVEPAPELEHEPAPEPVIHPNARRYKPVEEGPRIDLDLVAQLRAEGRTWVDIRAQVGVSRKLLLEDVEMWRPDLLGGDPHSSTNIHRKAIDLDRAETLAKEGYKWTSIGRMLGVCHVRLLRVVETERPHLVKHDGGA